MVGEELPTPDERLDEFHEEYPERALLQLSDRDGTSIRRDYCHERYEEWNSDAPIESEDSVSGHELVERKAFSWSEAVEKCLGDHADARRTTINLEYGRPSGPEYAEFSVAAETRWFATYQRRYYAQMKAWLRELCGGERPSGGVTEPYYDDPHIALITLSASSVPDGDRVGPLDHLRVRRDAWQDCYHTLRNTMRSIGYALGEAWQYDRRSEPHTGERGGGLNHCYGHDHIVLVVDGPLEAADLRPVVEKHVDSCDWAGAKAHDLDKDWSDPEVVNTVEVKQANEVDNLANYVASYCGIRPVDLLERSIEYVAWAAAATAANVRTVSRSDAARHAALADACKQRAESEASDQEREHAEVVITSDKRGAEVECIECGSPHGIDQSRKPPTAANPDPGPVAADGGVEDREQRLRDIWQDARAVTSIGESPIDYDRRKRISQYLRENPGASPAEVLGSLGLPPAARRIIAEIDAGIDPSEPIHFERGPEWRVKSVTVGEEEFPASAGNGVEMVDLELPVDRIMRETRCQYKRKMGESLRCRRCNVVMSRELMARHFWHYHRIADPEIADLCIKNEDYYELERDCMKDPNLVG